MESKFNKLFNKIINECTIISEAYHQLSYPGYNYVPLKKTPQQLQVLNQAKDFIIRIQNIIGKKIKFEDFYKNKLKQQFANGYIENCQDFYQIKIILEYIFFYCQRISKKRSLNKFDFSQKAYMSSDIETGKNFQKVFGGDLQKVKQVAQLAKNFHMWYDLNKNIIENEKWCLSENIRIIQHSIKEHKASIEDELKSSNPSQDEIKARQKLIKKLNTELAQLQQKISQYK